MYASTYLDQMLEPVTAAMSREFAERLCSLRIDPNMQIRVDELRRKANEGTSTPEEDAEYKEFVEAVDLISVLQAKARNVLVRQAG